MKVYWVKKWVTHKEYEQWYSKLPAYCWLERSGNEIAVGFLATTPSDGQTLFKLSKEELLKIDNYCRINRITPYPLEEAAPELKQETLNPITNEIDVQKIEF